MIERQLKTNNGTIVYWINDLQAAQANAQATSAAHSVAKSEQGVLCTLVFLPGLTADHRLFDKQIEYFENRFPLLVWDAPGHGESRPFNLNFSLEDKARWLCDILNAEGIEKPVLIGQSMGGYVSQTFLQLFPKRAAGFVCIDSAPLQRSYYTNWELWLLERMEPVYKWYPHSWLENQGSTGCAETPYGRELMRKMISEWDHKEYAAVASHGYRILAQAVRKNLPYEIKCPCVLICGEKDKAGSAKNYNKRWAAQTGLPMHWISGAGHNSNTDKPEEINAIIEKMCQ